jgi:hypothetical protein
MRNEAAEPAIEDLVDFYKYWPELRPNAIKMTKNNSLGDKDINILDWMIRVVDRVGPVDLEREQR